MIGTSNSIPNYLFKIFKKSVPILKIWTWRYELFPKVSSWWWHYWRGMVYEDSVFNNRLSLAVFIVRGPGGVEVESRRWPGISWGASYATCPMFCLITTQNKEGRTESPQMWMNCVFLPFGCFPKCFLRETTHIHTQIGTWLFMEVLFVKP